MIKIIDSPNMTKWEEFINNHPDGNIFQTRDMAEVYKGTKNYKPITLASVDDETDEIFGILQGVSIKERNGLLGTFSARSIIQGGPLFLNNSRGYEAAVALMKFYDNLVQKKVLYTEIRMLSKPYGLDLALCNSGYVFNEHFSALIDLKNKSVEDIWEQIKRDKKRGINKAEKMGIMIEECNEKENVRKAYELISETYKDAKIPLADISLFETTFNVLVPKKKALFLFAKYNNEYIATQVALIDNRTINAWYTGSNKRFISNHPGDILIWYLLKWGIENGYSTFDFGGGGSRNKNVNLREYKARFGAEFPESGRYRKIYSPIKSRIAEIGFGVYRRIIY